MWHLMLSLTLVAGFDAPPAVEDFDVKIAAGEYRVAVYEAFRSDRSRYEELRQPGDDLLCSWVASHEPAARKAEVIAWYQTNAKLVREAGAAKIPSAIPGLPTTVVATNQKNQRSLATKTPANDSKVDIGPVSDAGNVAPANSAVAKHDSTASTGSESARPSPVASSGGSTLRSLGGALISAVFPLARQQELSNIVHSVPTAKPISVNLGTPRTDAKAVDLVVPSVSLPADRSAPEADVQ